MTAESGVQLKRMYIVTQLEGRESEKQQKSPTEQEGNGGEVPGYTHK